MTNDPVDVVITWVDGNEQSHADKRARYLAQMGVVPTDASAPTRFNQCDEISYCVKSILRFAPWVRTIYIVTDAQTPAFMKQWIGTPLEEKVKLVDHRDIFSGFETYLPTFNSLSIESMLWRIEGLSNQFIYLNDDIFILRPVSYADFFQDNKIVLRGRWKVLSHKRWTARLMSGLSGLIKKQYSPAANDFFQIIHENTAKLVGWTTHYFQLLHIPLPARKNTFEQFFKTHPDVLLDNIQFAFRDHHQFMPFLLSQSLEIEQKNAVFDRGLTAIYINAACHSLSKIKHRLAKGEGRNKAAFICIQSMDLATESVKQVVFEWLNKRIG